MEYLTEHRGGWDEWEDEYEAVIGLIFSDGTEYRQRNFKDMFEDKDGNQLEVELPRRTSIGDNEICIERYDPEYESWFLTLSELEDHIDESAKIIRTDEL
jgi:hypothetical protein